jgi:hypothetical protein
MASFKAIHPFTHDLAMHASLFPTLLLSLSVVCSPVLPAQETSPATKAPAGADPFVRNKDNPPKQGEKAPVAPADALASALAGGGAANVAPGEGDALEFREPVHMIFTFESYSLPQEELDAIHDQTPKAPLFYERVRRLADDGKARLEMLLSLPTRSGQRATVESVDEVIYPTEFVPPVPGRDFGFPKAYEMMQVGERMELDPVLGPDGQWVDVNMGPDFVRLAGFVLQKSDQHAGGELQPLFTSHDCTTALTIRAGVPTFVGTVSRAQGSGVAEADGEAGKVEVMFITIRLSSAGVRLLPSKDRDPKMPVNLRTVYRFYSMPRATARDLLAKAASDVQLHAMVCALPATERKLEHLATLQTRSGQRALVEESVHYNHGIEIEVPKPARVQDDPPAKPVAGTPHVEPAPPVYVGPLCPGAFTKFEMRPLGWRIELDPVIGPSGQEIDINLALERTELRGKLEGHPLLARYPEQPVLATQKITTAVSMVAGRQCFLGTFSTPRDTGVNGRKDDGRTWFAFVKATLE